MSFRQILTGLVEPRVASFRDASRDDVAAFYAEAGRLAKILLTRQLMAGIGADGRVMVPRRRERPGFTGPVMSPHETRSRTIKLMAIKSSYLGVEIYWKAGIKRGVKVAFPTILGYHADGAAAGGIVRDVRMATKTIGKLRRDMGTWWTNKVNHAIRATRIRKGRAGIAARPVHRRREIRAN